MDTALEYTKRLADLLRIERGITADFLLALSDFDAKKLWRQLGHPSLFMYLHRELKLSKGAAWNRSVAAELIQQFPEVADAIRDGQLCLSTMKELARVLTPENRAEVLPRFFGLSQSEAEALSAALRPAKVIPTRDVVRMLRPAAPATAALPPVARTSSDSASSPGEPNSPVQGIEPRPADIETAPAFSLAPMRPPPRPEQTQHLDAERARLSITVSRGFLAKLEAAKDALGHVFPDGNAADILERGLDLVLAEHAKRKGLVAKPRTARPSTNQRHVPASLKREVWTRAGGRCEFVLPSGERCGCTRHLEFDHVDPVALGGRALTAADVRLLCRDHNQLAARRVFGDAVMDRYAPGRRTAGSKASSWAGPGHDERIEPAAAGRIWQDGSRRANP